MENSEEFVPTLVEWDELVQLWHRSRTVLASTLACSAEARLVWTARTFVTNNPRRLYAQVRAWLRNNLETARGATSSAREALKGTVMHEEVTANYRLPVS